MNISQLIEALQKAIEVGLLTKEEASAFFKSKLGVETITVVEDTPPAETPAVEQPAA